MPVEKSGQNEFDFEYGDQFGEKIEEYDPDFSKVLVRYNPEGDREMNERQTEQAAPPLRMAARAPPQVPVRAARAGRAGPAREGRRRHDRYDTEIRPELMMEAILQLQNAGVEADIWKIEGIDDREACREIAQLVRREGRDRVSCVVLGAAPRTRRSTSGCAPAPA